MKDVIYIDFEKLHHELQQARHAQLSEAGDCPFCWNSFLTKDGFDFCPKAEKRVQSLKEIAASGLFLAETTRVSQSEEQQTTHNT